MSFNFNIYGLISIIIGMLMIGFRKWYAKQNIRFSNKFYGLNFKENDLNVTIIVIVAIGIVLIIIGALMQFELIKPR